MKFNFGNAQMYHRDIGQELLVMAGKYPVVTLMGPRQSGKTTLVKELFRNKPYANLEAPDVRQLAIVDPRAFLNQFPEGAVLDEIQRAPELLSYIQTIVDGRNVNGLFILTGSHQLSLHEAITQSLAGRTALLNLYPMTLGELKREGFDLTLDAQLYKGFYPRVYQNDLNPTQAYRDYYGTYVERDVRQLINLKDVNLFDKFMRLCAGRIGSLVDLTSLGNDVGVSSNTVNHWLSILEASYLIVRLPPYFNNKNKRLIKTAKIYFTDVGLACYLLNIEEPKQLIRDPLRGFLFENMVIMELIKTRCNLNKKPNLYFYRDNHKNEVDVLIVSGDQFIAIEIKSAQTFTPEFLKGLNLMHKISPEKMTAGYVVYAGDYQQQINQFQLINYKNLSQIFL